MIGSCAKQRVQCAIYVKGRAEPILGENLCANPQNTCPRIAGEGYVKCFTNCGQIGHAEAVAIRQMLALGYLPKDVQRIIVYNHDRPCDSCRLMLTSYGLLELTTFTGPGNLFVMPSENLVNIADTYHLYEPSKHSRYTDVSAGLNSDVRNSGNDSDH